MTCGVMYLFLMESSMFYRKWSLFFSIIDCVQHNKPRFIHAVCTILLILKMVRVISRNTIEIFCRLVMCIHRIHSVLAYYNQGIPIMCWNNKYTASIKRGYFVLFLMFFVWLMFGQSIVYAKPNDREIAASAGVDEHLGDKIDGKLLVRTHLGEEIGLEKYFQEKPILFTLNYYSCASLCGVQLNAVLDGLKEMDWVTGQEFLSVTLSIDPEETSSLAAQKRTNYLEQLGKENADWQFLVAEQSVITSVADQFGYRYSYDQESKQYAHPAVIMILSPDGTISRYLYGLSYSARDLKFALIEASEGKIGSTVDKVILSCFAYDNTVGKYTASAFGLMRLAGAITVFVLGVMTTVLLRRDLKNTRYSDPRNE